MERLGESVQAHKPERRNGVKTSLLTGCLVSLVCLLPWGRTAAHAQTRRVLPEKRIRICVLPFYDTASDQVSPSDLGPLLQAYLSVDPWLDLVPAGRVYEKSYELEGDPWLVKGMWQDMEERDDAETYSWVRERWWMSVKARTSADYVLLGRVIATGMKRNVTVELLSGMRPDTLVFTAFCETPGAGELPRALEKVAGEIRGFLEVRRVEQHLKDLRRDRLAGICPLSMAVDEAERAVKANPESLSLRLLLLDFYAEDRSTYGNRLLRLAGGIVRAWNPLDSNTQDLAGELGIDPFLLLCEELEKKGDWSGVLDTARLGMNRNPLRSAEYRKWASRAEERLRSSGNKP